MGKLLWKRGAKMVILVPILQPKLALILLHRKFSFIKMKKLYRTEFRASTMLCNKGKTFYGSQITAAGVNLMQYTGKKSRNDSIFI